MSTTIADELYSETLKQSNVEVGQLSYAETKNFDSIDCDGDELWHDDGSSWNGSNEELDKASELDREWQRRREQFHTIGYRDGLMAGKEASAQEGFNIGFGESVFVGYKWGLVRGVTSALACLPDAVRKRLVEYEEKRAKFLNIHESVYALSTTDALKLFHDDMSKKLVNQRDTAESSSHKEEGSNQGSNDNTLETFYVDIRSLVLESPALEVHLEIDQMFSTV